MQIISPRRTVHVAEFSFQYDDRTCPGGGFGFPCKADGTLLPLGPSAQASLDYVVDNLDTFKVVGVVDLSRDVREPAVGRCDDCRRQVYLEDALTNECDCGALYNMSGQRLRPRHEWAEDCDA